MILLGAVLPLLITPGLLFHYDTASKVVILELAAAAALFMGVFRRVEFGALWSRRSGRLLIWIAALQVIWFSIATALSSRPWFSLFGSAWRQFGLMTTIPLMIVTVLTAAYLCGHPERARLLLRTFACAGLAASIYGIAQYFDIDPLQTGSGYHAHAGDSVIVRPPGTMGHADYFAWWLTVEFFCAIGLTKIETPVWRTVAVGVAVLTGIATLLTGTRAALVAMAAGALALTILLGTGIHKRHVLAACAGAGLLALLFYSPEGIRLRARVIWSGEEPIGGGRPLLWRDSLRMAGARPVFGFGPETFPAAFGPYESEDLAHLYPDFHYESPHNVALDALTSQGVPGLLLLMAWVGLAIRAARKARRAGTPLAAPLAAALVASGTAQMFSAAVLAPVLLSLLVLAILVSASSPTANFSPVSPGWRTRIAFSVAGVALMAYAAAITIADFNLARFQRRPEIAAYESAARLRLPGAAEDIYCSRALSNICRGTGGIGPRLECWHTAVQAAARATVTADDPANAWYNLAIFTAAQNDAAGTKRALTAASRMAPVWFKPHWLLARLLSQTGERAAAISEAERAESLDNKRDPEVAQTARSLKQEQ
jgi:O-antigen ligase